MQRRAALREGHQHRDFKKIAEAVLAFGVA
jgi:hypothetical protein